VTHPLTVLEHASRGLSATAELLVVHRFAPLARAMHMNVDKY